jgi:hypothetical protein
MIPVFSARQLVGFLTIPPPPDWDKGNKPLYRFAKGRTPDAGTPVTFRTVFDSYRRPIALEIDDPEPLGGWAEFRFMREIRAGSR